MDEEKILKMTKEEKISVIETYKQLMFYELNNLPEEKIRVFDTRGAEYIAEEYFESQGYSVYRSRVKDGYRSVGVEFYWPQYKDKITKKDREMIEKLKSIMSYEDFYEFAYIVKDKRGTPDLLLIKDDKISFVEVKCNYETIKDPTIEFFIRYKDKWPLKVLRVIKISL